MIRVDWARWSGDYIIYILELNVEPIRKSHMTFVPIPKYVSSSTHPN
jgi:hypothetical protein